MLSTSAKIAGKLEAVIQEKNLKKTAIAEACGVTKQAVQGWLKTGRIDKKHLPKLAELSGQSLDWWLSDEIQLGQKDQAGAFSELDENARILAELKNWRQRASSRSQAVIDQLCVLAQTNALREEDWTLIEQTAAHLRSRR